MIPQAAVIEVQSMYQVVVLTPDNKASFRPVKVGERVGPNWMISEGLKPGEKVIVEGFMKSTRRRAGQSQAICASSGRRQGGN